MTGVILYPGKDLQVSSQLLANAYCMLVTVAVMDVYSAWCGPCKAVQGLFRRLKNEIGDNLLRFGLVS